MGFLTGLCIGFVVGIAFVLYAFHCYLKDQTHGIDKV